VEGKDANKTVNCAQKLEIRTITVSNSQEELREWALNYFNDNSSFGDVLEWQKAERSYKKLPYRD
jgi:hypothetical protein